MNRSDLTLHNVTPASARDLQHGVFIVLFHARRIPPHLLLCVDGLTYSISVKGQFADEPLDVILGYALRKKVECLFVEWILPEQLSREDLKKIIRRNILAYEKVEEEKTSCLSPIRDTVADIHGETFRKAGFVFELIPAMRHRKLIGRSFSLNMDLSKEQGTFRLLTYTREQLCDAIGAASRKHSE